MEKIEIELEQRILILDGAMGTMIQTCGLEEKDFRSESLANHPVELKGNNELLNITRPDVIQKIHQMYLEAGADIIETNTFNGNRFSQAEYDTASLVYDINYIGAKLARVAADRILQEEGSRPRFVAGAMGPTTKLASMSTDVNNPGHRLVSFDELVECYTEQAEALIEGGVDLFLLETVTDTLNAKAALYALNQLFRHKNRTWPIMVSGTITDASGRILSGQTIEAFLISISHAPLLSVGLNCALGAKELRPYIQTLSKECPFYVSIHPNAGLPNEFGKYDQTPEEFSSIMAEFAKQGWVNIVGGCCGTTPEHIKKLSQILTSIYPRTKGYTAEKRNQVYETPFEIVETMLDWSKRDTPSDNPTFDLHQLRQMVSQIEDEQTYYNAYKSFKKEKHMYHSEQAMLIGAQFWGRFQYLRIENRL